MCKQFLGGVFSLVAILFSAVFSSAHVIGTTARQMGKGELQTLLYYQGARAQDLTFSVTDLATCAAAPPSGAVTFPCSTTGDLDAEGSGEAMSMKFAYQPHERGLQLYASIGAGEYAVKIGTVTVFDSAFLNRSGFISALGAKAVIWPDTIVTPALAVDGSVGWQRYFGNSRLDLFELQLALETSHRFALKESRGRLELEPYGGVKWLRTQTFLTDVGTRRRVEGKQDSITPFVGLKIPIFTEDSVFVEIAFVKGVQIGSGFAVRFQ